MYKRQDLNNFPNSAFALAECKKQLEAEERIKSSKRVYEQKVANSELVKQLEKQNRSLQEQISLLKEESERQKQQLAHIAAKEAEDKKAFHRERIFNWISFGVATLLSVVALIVAIVK